MTPPNPSTSQRSIAVFVQPVCGLSDTTVYRQRGHAALVWRLLASYLFFALIDHLSRKPRAPSSCRVANAWEHTPRTRVPNRPRRAQRRPASITAHDVLRRRAGLRVPLEDERKENRPCLPLPWIEKGRSAVAHCSPASIASQSNAATPYCTYVQSVEQGAGGEKKKSRWESAAANPALG